jgi:protein-S-isoprenylcysteine O-methyltransferase Ste14
MRELAMVACLGALALIALLPRLFFRRGRLNARWWLTAAPFVVAGTTLVAGLTGLLEPNGAVALRDALAWPALGAAAGAVALIRWTLDTHARPVSLWHQEDDRPEELVTRGAYARVRHPFYASFLLVLVGCVLAFPHALTLLALAGGFLQLDRTAAREERRLRHAFGEPYASYVRRTGRFLPFRIVALVLLATLTWPGTGVAQEAAKVPSEPWVESGTRDDSVPATVKRAAPDNRIVESMKLGAAAGLTVGMAVSYVACAWAELDAGTLGDPGESEDDEGCPLAFLEIVGPPVIGLAAGAVVGLLTGIVAHLLGGLGDEPTPMGAAP